MSLVLPDPRIEVPGLRHPNKLPYGDVVVDKNNLLSKGLVAACVFNPNAYGDRLKDLSGHGNDLINLSPSKATPAGHNFDLVERPELAASNEIPTDGNITLVCRTTFRSWQTDGSIIRRDDGSPTWVLDVNNSVELRFVRSGLAALTYAVTNLSLDRIYTIVATCQPFDNRLEVDGMVVDSNVDGSWNAWGTPTAPVYIGNEDGSLDEHDGIMELFYIYNRGMTREETRLLGANPYRILTSSPRPSKIFFLASTGVITRTLSDSATVSDSLGVVKSSVRVLSDQVSQFTDQVLPLKNIFRLLSDSSEVSDILTKYKNYVRSLSEAVTLYDSLPLARSVELFRVQEDYIYTMDTLVKTMKLVRELYDSADIYELVSATVVTGGIVIITRALSDGLDVYDTRNVVTESLRVLEDSLSVDDAALRHIESVRDLYDSILDISDSISAVKELPRELTDYISVTDTTVSIQVLIRELLDSCSTADELSALYETLIQAQIFITIGLRGSAEAVTDIRTNIEVDLK